MFHDVERPKNTRGGYAGSNWSTGYHHRVLADDRYQITLYESHSHEAGYKMSSSVRITSYLEVKDLVSGCCKTISHQIPDTFGPSRFDVHLGDKVEDVSVDGLKLTITTSFGVGRQKLEVSLDDSGAG